MRRNIVRYSLLSYCMCMRTVSFRVKKRFPDLQVYFLSSICKVTLYLNSYLFGSTSLTLD